MAIDFFSLRKIDQKDLILHASRMSGLSPVVLEKDLWVCLVLKILFESPYREHLTFKGGTSLSKAYDIIHRFSEDIDITFDKQLFVPPKSYDEINQMSRKKRGEYIETISEKAKLWARRVLAPHVTQISSAIGLNDVSIRIHDTDPLAVVFSFPSVLDNVYTYIKPSVYIEGGIRADTYPRESRKIESYLHRMTRNKQIPLDLEPLTTKVFSMHPLRTLYEKATLLHAEFHRDPQKPMPNHYSRHYYDVHKLIQQKYPHDIKLLQDVVRNKKMFFPSTWAHYDDIAISGIKILPNPQRMAEIKRDYEHMSVMF